MSLNVLQEQRNINSAECLSSMICQLKVSGNYKNIQCNNYCRPCDTADDFKESRKSSHTVLTIL